MNKKGFTLVELLLVIVIIAIISLVVLPNIMDILNTSKNKKWTTIEDIVKTNLELYNIDYLEDLWNFGCIPDPETGETCEGKNDISKYEFKTKEEIDEVLDINSDIDLDICEVTYMNIEKEGNKDFEYNVCISCGDEYKSEYDYCLN